MTREFVIGPDRISDESDCYVIAEIGNNHQGDLRKAKELISAAKQAGCDAVKFQKRDNRALFTARMYDEPYNSENAFAETYGLHREAVELSGEAMRELRDFAAEQGITWFSTAFDIPSANLLMELDPPAFKIASADLTNTLLLRHVAAFGKPMIISTGGATMEDVERAYATISEFDCDLCILQCTSSYPASVEELDLQVIATYRERFPDCVIGFSGHENGISMPLIAYMLGARVVEKHFTLDRTLKGTDHVFSLTPDGMRRMVRDLRRAKQALGSSTKRTFSSEVAPMRKMAKTLVAARDIPAGRILGPDDVVAKVARSGLPPYEHERVIGKRTKEPLKIDDTVTFEMLSDA